MLKHAEAIASRLATDLKLGPASLAAEIASNDGYLLKNYVARGIPVLGIEPIARNVAKVFAQENGVRTLTEFFGAGARSKARERRAARERAPREQRDGARAGHQRRSRWSGLSLLSFLAQDGVFVMETPYAKQMPSGSSTGVRTLIYHEHLFTIRSPHSPH